MIPINPRDPRPIYLQIKEGLCRLILSGAVKTGERLPSVRELAGQLAINPNTIQRAYRELENDGFIYSVSGKGSFAAALAEVDAGRRSAKEREFRAAALELLRLGTPKADLMAILDQLEEEDSNDA
ncbi:MAG TPA: GntR family transcriptional regulator [Candidatus Avoscillospira avicola]|uniref:GntR family transcriptional regulator n=1 Tax=Candidatus Avoscillospira avicola TaxID=2840706 RepID=A0A9D1DJF8_9FIRM|nr:GntR family transcriptional regulator [Candidatus Avoscillospira avicola]